jgi:pheromone shutdown protein TraB
VDPDTLDPELVELFKKADWRDPAAAVETLKTRKAAGAMAQLLRTQFPKIASAMLDQRDDIMTNGLLTAAREKGGPSKIVAVVGMAHMDGIEERWEKAQGSGGGVTRISGG